jgi:hypothetical protein
VTVLAEVKDDDGELIQPPTTSMADPAMHLFLLTVSSVDDIGGVE